MFLHADSEDSDQTGRFCHASFVSIKRTGSIKGRFIGDESFQSYDPKF